MGRTGGGSSGGGHSGGGHSVSRSSGGHRVGGSSSSRPMGGASRPTGGFGGGRPSSTPPRGGNYGAPPPPRGGYYGAPPPPRGGHYGAPPPPRGGYYGAPPPPPRGGGRRSGGGCVSSLISVVILLIFIGILLGMFSSFGGGSSTDIPASSYNREKLDSGNGYINDCIYDELGWFDNVSRTESRLKDFYEETGVQPYIMLLDYIPGVDSDSQKEEYARQLYEENIDNESTFLYVYFAEENESESDDPGYMCYVNGIQVSSVMDAEALDIFWAYLDKYWYTDMSTDDMFVKIFNSTADTIMTKSTTSKDVAKYVLIVVAAGVVVFGVVKVVKLKHKRAKEEAEETERILNTPMESLVDEELKKTAAKYDEKNSIPYRKMLK